MEKSNPTPPNEARLLPCPFCGNEAKYWFNPSDDGCGEPNHQCHCTRCEASITFSASEDDAIKNWNTRVTYKRDEPKGLKSAEEWRQAFLTHIDCLEYQAEKQSVEIDKLRGVIEKMREALKGMMLQYGSMRVTQPKKVLAYGNASEALRSADKVLE